LIADGHSQRLHDYIDGVLSGAITVSIAVRHAVQRHVADMQRQSTDGFPFHFDATLAAKTCRFFPTMIRHSIGRFAGMPFELSPFQIFCKSMIFGWLRDADKTRRFRKAYRSYARKNGKSTDIAAESIYLAGFDRNPNTGKPEAVAQVVLSATKRDQVDKVIFAEVVRMREKSKLIADKSRFVSREVKFIHNDGEIVTTGSDKPYDGLNPHSVAMDELQAWREFHRQFYDTMITGSGSRDQPLISIITTAGDDRSMLWKEVYDYSKAVALGTVEDDQFFSFIAEIDEDDDPFDESVWLKANPNLGVSVSIDYLRQQATESQTTSIGRNRFTRYHGNRLVTSTEKAFDLDQWDECGGTLSDWKTADVICGGFDLGGYDDLAAFALVARFIMSTSGDKQIYRYEAKTFAFISDRAERDLNAQPWFNWIYDGYLKKTEYPQTALRDELIEKCRENYVEKVAFDPSNARSTAEEMTKEGFIVASMGQNCTNFNEPIHDLMNAIKEGRFRHDGNPLLRWCVNNAVVIKDRQDRWMFDKRDSSDKIDPVVAMTMAFRLATLEPARATGSLYVV
jgi:phage terminase large subunit-like protein